MRPYPSGGCGVGFPLHSRRHFRFYVCLSAMMTLDLTDYVQTLRTSPKLEARLSQKA